MAQSTDTLPLHLAGFTRASEAEGRPKIAGPLAAAGREEEEEEKGEGVYVKDPDQGLGRDRQERPVHASAYAGKEEKEEDGDAHPLLPETWQEDLHPFVYKFSGGPKAIMVVVCLPVGWRRRSQEGYRERERGRKRGVGVSKEEGRDGEEGLPTEGEQGGEQGGGLGTEGGNKKGEGFCIGNLDEVIARVHRWDKAHGGQQKPSFYDWDKQRWIRCNKWLGVSVNGNR